MERDNHDLAIAEMRHHYHKDHYHHQYKLQSKLQGKLQNKLQDCPESDGVSPFVYNALCRAEPQVFLAVRLTSTLQELSHAIGKLDLVLPFLVHVATNVLFWSLLWDSL